MKVCKSLTVNEYVTVFHQPQTASMDPLIRPKLHNRMMAPWKATTVRSTHTHPQWRMCPNSQHAKSHIMITFTFKCYTQMLTHTVRMFRVSLAWYSETHQKPNRPRGVSRLDLISVYERFRDLLKMKTRVQWSVVVKCLKTSCLLPAHYGPWSKVSQ